MEKNYNYNYENRAQTKSSVSYSNVELASCKASVLKKMPISNGMLWHTTDTNEFYYDWNGKRSKLNASGGGSNIDAEIAKIKADLAKLNPDSVQQKINQLENKVNNAASQASSAKQTAQNAKQTATSAAQDAAQAAQDAQEAAAQVANKADKSYVDDAIAGITVPDLSDYAKKTDIPDVSNFIEESDLADYAKKTDIPDTSNFIEESDLADYAKKTDIPDTSNFIEESDLADYAKKSDLPNVENFVEESDLADYAKKEDMPEIPENVSAFINDAGYITASDLPDFFKDSELDDYVKIEDLENFIPKSELENLAAKSDLEGYVKTEDAVNYLTNADLEGYAKEEDLADYAKADDLADYETKADLSERLGIIGQEVESNVYEYIYNKASWEASYNDGVLKEYYTQYPNEDLWNFDTNSAPGFNDKIYTVEEYADAACEGEYVVKQYKAQWYSDNGVQKIIDVNDNSIEYYIPTFFDTPTQIFELFAGAEGGYVATPDDLVYPCDKWIKVKEVNFGGPNVRPAWEAAVQAPGAQFPWIALKVENVENQIVKFEYEGKDGVYPWGEKRFGLGGKSWGIASVAKEWGDNSFLIEANKNNGREDWVGELGVDYDDFDISLFKLVLVTPSSVKDYVDAAVASVNPDIPEVPENVSAFVNDAGYITEADLPDYLTESDLDAFAIGQFPAAADADEPTATEDGYAKVQDVMDYVNALFEKKKDELGPAPVPTAYITGYALDGTPTNITEFNPFELNEDSDTVIEFYAPQEIGAWDPSTNDDLPSIKLTVELPDGYTISEAYIWDNISSQYSLLNVNNQFGVNPRYSSRVINGVTYNSYVRGPVNDQGTRGLQKYKIIITK